jgi:voltage-gated potassium channel
MDAVSLVGQRKRRAPRVPASAAGAKGRGSLHLVGRTSTVLALVASLLVLGTSGFHYIEGWGWFRAFYGTLMTVSTIGAEPENQLSYPGQIFNVILIVLGVCVVGFIMATLAQAVIEFELGSFFGRRRMEKELAKIRDHFIICGAGRVGRRVAMEVEARGLPVVIIEQEAVKAQWAQEHGFHVIIGDATHEAVLKQARIEHAAGLASAVTSDAQNVYIVLTARGVAPRIPIVARASEEDAESKLLKAGANTVISPYTYAGQRIARTLTRPHVQRFLDIALSSLNDGGLDLEIEEVEVGSGSQLSGVSLSEADVRHRLGVIVLAIRREGQALEFNPPPDRQIAPGDFLIVMGDAQRLKDLETLAGI